VAARPSTLKGSEKFLAISAKIKLVKDNSLEDFKAFDNFQN